MDDLIFDEDGNVRLERIIYEIAMKQQDIFTARMVNHTLIKLNRITNMDLVLEVLDKCVYNGELNKFGEHYLPQQIKYVVTAE
jgi:hypothetical protein